MYIEDLQERYIVSRWAYLCGEPIISDIEYDKTERNFKLLYPDDIHSKQPWSFDECPQELLKKYNLEHLICNPTMGYMAESIYSVNNQLEYYQTFKSLNQRSRLSFKIDGWNTRVSYFNGYLVKVESRGRSGNNLSMNNIARLFPPKIKYKCRVAITGELSIPNKVWKEFKELTGNEDQRASVRTALVRGDINYLAFCAFNIFIEDGSEIDDQYDLLQNLGFTTPRFIWVNNFEELEKGLKYMSYISHGYYYLTDGLVIENKNMQLAIRLGAWEEHAYRSYVIGYEENQGMYGTFLKVLCYPIKIGGKTFGRISVNNIAYIIENNLRKGYPIAFNKRSEANVVLDASETAQLQKQWSERLESYQAKIKRESTQ